MLSILIPTYNYNAFALVSAIHEQALKASIPFEIICLDDASTLFLIENEHINELPNARYEKLDNNIGRSKIRNLLAKKAAFDWLLFLDSDVFPKSENFIAAYLPHLNEVQKVVNGGLLYQDQKPEKNKLLRWVYGRKREALSWRQREKNPYRSFLTLNFLIHEAIFKKVSFNEDIPNLRHEDTLFSYDLKRSEIPIIQIDNPICHLGLDTFENTIRKENESLFVLKYLTDIQLLAPDYLKISRLFFSIKKWKLIPIATRFHHMTKLAFLSNLSGNNPSLFIFDLYRLGYLCSLEKN